MDSLTFASNVVFTGGLFILAVVTILASDEANGIVNFDSGDNITINEPSPHSSSNGKATLRLVRAPGIYGIVRVPYVIVAANGDKTVTDLTPVSGQVTFINKQVSGKSKSGNWQRDW